MLVVGNEASPLPPFFVIVPPRSVSVALYCVESMGDGRRALLYRFVDAKCTTALCGMQYRSTQCWISSS